MSYVLELSDEQAQVLQAACETLGRIGSGQFFTLSEHAPRVDGAAWYEFCKHVDIMQHILAISSDKQCTDESRVAWDLYQVVRHRLAWDREPKGGFTTDFHEPLPRSGKPLAQMRKDLNKLNET